LQLSSFSLLCPSGRVTPQKFANSNLSTGRIVCRGKSARGEPVSVLMFWALEFILESCGAYLYWQKSKLLSALLGMCAVGDIITFLLYGHPGYASAFWIYYSLKYLVLIWLACSICGMFVAEKRKSFATISAAFLSLASGALITVFSANGETLKDKLLDGEIAANMILLAIVFIGWIGRRDRLTGTWKWITVGFMVMVGSDLVFTILWTFWDGARHWYPLGAIAAQAIWIIGPMRKVRLDCARLELGRAFIEEDIRRLEQVKF
jgi:hypothetical protein